jgi:hypothetical protein
VKAFAVFVLVLAAVVPAHADTTQTWDISATQCTNVISCNVGTVPFDLEAQMLTTTETGLFFWEFLGESDLPGTAPVETSIAGTFDGMPVSTPDLTAGPNGISAWLLETGPFIVPMGIEFESSGSIYTILFDDGYQIFNLTDLSAPISGEQVLWSAVDVTHVPEPAAVWLLLTALFLLGLSRWALEQQSIRRRRSQVE